MATAHESDGALGDLIDPELPSSTYVLEPEVVSPLVKRVVTSHDAGTHRSTSPFTGAPLAAVPLSSTDDVADAVERARVAQHDWAATPLAERARVLDRLGTLVLDRQSEILDLIQMESGKSRRSAFEEVADIAQACRHYVVRGPRYLADRRVPGALSVLTGARVHRRPVGVVGVISPWNYPLTLALCEAIPALLAGNAVVLKPDPQTTLSALWAAELLAEAGLPDDLFSVVAGGGEIGAALVDHVDHIAFTGSTAVGRTVAARAGERLIGATLELGGKNPLYVAADADLDAAVPGVVRACFSNAGQLCMSIERLVLHERIADAFLERFVPAVRELALGAGLDYTADIGSLVSADQLERVAAHVDDALAKGARALTGGVHRADVGPYFYAPTVLDDLPEDAVCLREETFGPVVAVSRVASDDEAVRVMNDTEFGLNASIWSRDVVRARQVAARVEAGTVVINDGYLQAWGSASAPMGGMKASGLGRRHGREAIEAVTEVQSVVAQRGLSAGLSLDTLYALGGDVPSRALTQALRGMRRLRLP
ncbi:succinate-semialdehyde dehydrogenase/glutarate-semialdehyde dehydrogenase [Isoptericola sp. CG 20/1183]|uniref:Aldehyde dehydrogenase n=1 Tax=Isoptericola halotolerans TaxID=300560 RepID=A0ABX5EGV3_9MICO|nr:MULTISPECIES: succinic semialdehyde dehydrogenase [Isoptericola]PRZ06986.1 succinate-semialdehyde dehydrogenase/glutarate-semialdehyde dehydrogenase [Isoptericola halotolerans]PRZ07342.1 succinate-semialdehyde dehydrogenase/glutarate-semialdehyde dehydrogenase [Isoptericola sp. CG 20/1183]